MLRLLFTAWVAPVLAAAVAEVMDHSENQQSNVLPIVHRFGLSRFVGCDLSPYAFSADGRRLLTTSTFGRVIQCWDVATGAEMLRLSVKPLDQSSKPLLSISHDGRYLAVAGAELRCYRISDGKLLRQWPRGKNCAYVGFLSDSTTLALLGDSLSFLDVATGATLSTHKDITEEKWRSPVVSANGKTCAGIAGADRLEIVAVGGGDKRVGFTVPNVREVKRCFFSPRGTYLIVECDLRSSSDAILVYDLSARKVTHRFLTDRTCEGVTVSQDETVLAACDGHRCYVWSIPSKAEIKLRDSVHHITSCALSSDGRQLAVGGGTSPLEIWQLDPDGSYHRQDQYRGPVREVTASPDGRWLAVFDGETSVWDLCTGQRLSRFGKPATAGVATKRNLKRLAFSADSSLLAATDGDQTLALYSLHTGKYQFQHTFVNTDILAVGFSRAQSHLLFVAVVEDKEGHRREHRLGRISLTRPQERLDLQPLDPMDSPWTINTEAKITADGRRILIADENCMVRLYDVLTLRMTELTPAEGNNEIYLPFGLMSLSPDDRLAACKTYAHRLGMPIRDDDSGYGLTVYETASHQLRASLLNFPTATCSFSLSPNNRFLAIGLEGGALELWDLQSKKRRLKSHLHKGDILSVCFTPNGRGLITGSLDTTAAVWDVESLLSQAPILREELPPLPFRPTRCWKALAGNEPAQVSRAVREMTVHPSEAIVHLSKELRPIRSLTERQGQRLLEGLASDSFEARSRAYDALVEHGDQAIPFIRTALKLSPTPDLKRQLDNLLLDLAPLSVHPLRLRAVRAVEVLERIGTVEAEKLLESLARGHPGAVLTDEAQRALRRLRLRLP
jgi:WD40 repeat protein